jgi:hypothetical protein
MKSFSDKILEKQNIDWALSDPLNRVELTELCTAMQMMLDRLDDIPSTIEAELSESEVEHLARVVAEQLQDVFDGRFGEIERQIEAIHIILAEER